MYPFFAFTAVYKAVKQAQGSAHLYSHCYEFRFTDICLMDSFNQIDYICKARNGCAFTSSPACFSCCISLQLITYLSQLLFSSIYCSVWNYHSVYFCPFIAVTFSDSTIIPLYYILLSYSRCVAKWIDTFTAIPITDRLAFSAR